MAENVKEECENSPLKNQAKDQVWALFESVQRLVVRATSMLLNLRECFHTISMCFQFNAAFEVTENQNLGHWLNDAMASRAVFAQAIKLTFSKPYLMDTLLQTYAGIAAR